MPIGTRGMAQGLSWNMQMRVNTVNWPWKLARSMERRAKRLPPASSLQPPPPGWEGGSTGAVDQESALITDRMAKSPLVQASVAGANSDLFLFDCIAREKKFMHRADINMTINMAVTTHNMKPIRGADISH